MRRALRLVTALLGAALLSGAADARAAFGVSTVVPDYVPVPAGAPALRYGRLDRVACETELERRAIPFVRVDEARGVLAPVRLRGPLHGVTFRTGLPEAQRASSPWEIVDCRLALALDDFAAQLATHDITQVIHFSVYRPPVKSWPEGKLASRHPGALAIDAGTFVKRDGTKLEVERDFHGRIGAATCTGSGPHPATPEALELRRIVCDAAGARLFNVALTPDYNWPHRNHFHLEVTAGVGWFVVH
ncbi:MAG TPA: extensin family protein [Polyangiaceae bacterium]|jgi:hypothetical protein|nr:extensin family protein [Polyangiaceae bacterium]